MFVVSLNIKYSGAFSYSFRGSVICPPFHKEGGHGGGARLALYRPTITACRGRGQAATSRYCWLTQVKYKKYLLKRPKNFDDEFLRFCFYRNLLSPYTHQYKNKIKTNNKLNISWFLLLFIIKLTRTMTSKIHPALIFATTLNNESQDQNDNFTHYFWRTNFCNYFRQGWLWCKLSNCQ